MTKTSPASTDGALSDKKSDRWAYAALTELENVAARYGAYITYSALLKLVVSDDEKKQITNYWSNRVLGKVIDLCEQRGLPPLTSLVVQEATGMVGRGFETVMKRLGQQVPDTQLERERIAAAHRLDCYRAYCPIVPADAKPELTREYDIYRADVERKSRPKPLSRPVCPTCGIQKPATGTCDTCD